MPKLDKGTLALTFRFDSDRFLKFRLLPDTDLVRRGALKEVTDSRGRSTARPHTLRPGVGLAKSAGSGWEIEKFEDLVHAFGTTRVHHHRSRVVHPVVKKRRFRTVSETELRTVLERPVPPHAIIEGEFSVPRDITRGLAHAFAQGHLDQASARPDVLLIRPATDATPLMTPPTRRRTPGRPPHEIHVVDVKYAAQPSLRHFTEVTFYAMALEKWLEHQGLDHQYAVSAQGLVWPGTHEIGAFRSLVRARTDDGTDDPVWAALGETLVPVPYEVYRVHVRQFFDGRLLRVLDTPADDLEYHVSPTCQLCDYLPYCEATAAAAQHLSRIPWLTRGQADLLRRHKIPDVPGLARAIADQTPAWRDAKADSAQLRAEETILGARAKALTDQVAVFADGRKSAAMPRYVDMSIYITIHFDFSTGITFAFGASRTYYPPGAPRDGRPPVVNRMTPAIVDKVDRSALPSSERARLLEFVGTVTTWLREADVENRRLAAEQVARGEKPGDYGKVRAHIFVWDALELTQLRRTFLRHMADPEVMAAAEEFMRMFPPDEVLPDPEAFRSQPGTVVKDVMRVLVGLPIPHDYTLFEVANTFHPPTRLSKRTGRPIRFGVPWGFVAPMSDQIPFERAHELWVDNPKQYALRHPLRPGETERARFQRADNIDGLRHAVRRRLDALTHVVEQLRTHHGEALTLTKSAFYAEPVAKPLDVPRPSRRLYAFQQLDSITREIETRARHALPVDEREARFHAMRGLVLLPRGAYDAELARLRTEKPRYETKTLVAFAYSPGSRDTRIAEGDFTLALSNERRPGDPAREPLDIDLPWRTHLGLSPTLAGAAWHAAGLNVRDVWRPAIAPLSALLSVEVALLAPAESPPVVVLAFNKPAVFDFAVARGLVDLHQPLVLDPVHADFETTRVRQVLLDLGGGTGSAGKGVGASVNGSGPASAPTAGSGGTP